MDQAPLEKTPAAIAFAPPAVNKAMRREGSRQLLALLIGFLIPLAPSLAAMDLPQAFAPGLGVGLLALGGFALWDDKRSRVHVHHAWCEGVFERHGIQRNPGGETCAPTLVQFVRARFWQRELSDVGVALATESGIVFLSQQGMRWSLAPAEMRAASFGRGFGLLGLVLFLVKGLRIEYEGGARLALLPLGGYPVEGRARLKALAGGWGLPPV